MAHQLPTHLAAQAALSESHSAGMGLREMLRVEIQSLNTVATLYCSGTLVLGLEIETLRTMVQSRQEQHLRVDLAGVDKIDASGLGLLVELQIWARENDRTIAFMDLSESVWRIVILTKLYSALEISYSDVDAITSDCDQYGRSEMIA